MQKVVGVKIHYTELADLLSEVKSDKGDKGDKVLLKTLSVHGGLILFKFRH